MEPHPTILAPGVVVGGRYRVEQAIGAGGFGVVFRATQLNLGRAVALKVLLPELIDGGEGIARFLQEAQLAQRLEHPNTVRVLDFGRTDDGAPYLVFELLRGQPLDAAIRACQSGDRGCAPKGGMPPERVARVAIQVLKSLMEAHSLGIVHRDIKPPNLFLCDFPGERDFVKVLDFGIAKAVGAQGLTRAGAVVGTPNYMAPEQVRGQGAGPPADLYALGLVMSEALSGEPVFQGPTGLEICMAQIADTPPPHAAAALRSPLAPVILRATQKWVNRRYASAAEMLQHLESISFAQAPIHDVRTQAPTAQVMPMGYGAPPPQQQQGYAPTNMQSGMTPPPLAYSVGSGPMGYGAPQTPPWGPPAPIPAAYATPYAPHLAPAPVRQLKGHGPTSWLMLAALSVGFGVTALGVLVTAIALHGSRSDDDESGAGDESSVGSTSPIALSTLTDETLKKQLVGAGYEITNHTVSHSNGLDSTMMVIGKARRFGSVQIYRMADAASAEQLERSMRSVSTTATRREGRLLLIATMGNGADSSNAASEALLREIVR